MWISTSLWILTSLLAQGADRVTTGATIGGVPVVAIPEDVFWSHVALTPILQGPAGLRLEQADVSVLDGRISLSLTSEDEAVIDWAASYLRIGGQAVPVRFVPTVPVPVIEPRRDRYGYRFQPAAAERAPLYAEVLAIPAGGRLDGEVTRRDGLPLMGRPQPGDEAPALVLHRRDAPEPIALRLGVSIGSGMIPAYCDDLTVRRREGWVNLAGLVALTGGLTATSVIINTAERAAIDGPPTLPTAGLLALTATSAGATIYQGVQAVSLRGQHRQRCAGHAQP